MSGILDGIKVIDFGRAAVGPLSATYLGMMGADVIKVEPPEGDTVRWGNPRMKDMGTTFMGNNVGKRGIALNLKDPDDRSIALQLCAKADVIVDNYRSEDVMIRLGLGYEAIAKVNPRIVYLQSSAYGNRGPSKGMASGEWYAQAAGAFTSVNGVPGGLPQFVRGTANLDWNAAMCNCEGIMIALYVRERTGRGMYVQTSQFQSSIAASITRLAEYFATGEAPGLMGSARPNIVPDQAFATSDGWINVTVPHEGFWSKLCKAIDRPDLIADARFASNSDRIQNRGLIVAILQDEFGKKTSAEWLAILRGNDVPCGEYFTDKPLSYALMEHPQVHVNDLTTTIDSQWGPLNSVNPHWTFSDYTCAIQRPPPALGEHRDEIIRDWLGEVVEVAAG